MSQPMLEIKDGKSTSKTKAHLLPCRIHHNGSIEPTASFWAPTQTDDGKNTAYFRGRKLNGQVAKLPEGYRGVVVQRVESQSEKNKQQDQAGVIDVDAEDQVDFGQLQTKGDFDEMVIWDHEALADTTTDSYIRCVEEWLPMADSIHSYSSEPSQ